MRRRRASNRSAKALLIECKAVLASMDLSLGFLIGTEVMSRCSAHEKRLKFTGTRDRNPYVQVAWESASVAKLGFSTEDGELTSERNSCHLVFK